MRGSVLGLNATCAELFGTAQGFPASRWRSARRLPYRSLASRLSESAGAAQPDVQISQEGAEPSAGLGVQVGDRPACGLMLAQVVQRIAKVLGGGEVESELSDLRQHPNQWENPTLERFLGALSASLSALPSLYANEGGDLPEQPTWKLLAEVLVMASGYE
ncbi:hypothetical protein OOJ91_11705 [Micromonospora lupini]|uniref:DUF7660 family protein n=1 Tax=Micromonospora lupini TaxID=285679 RepID=UPI002250D5C1|nr:hypothetical protein [Micromonospora lupini]MCX5066543.1 hypothetical protein [Micromonospora lupini]